MPKKNNKKDNRDDQIISLENDLKRLAADFANYQKRSEEQKLNIIMSANTDLMIKVTPVLDNFRRAFEHAPNPPAGGDNFALGVKQIEKQLEDILTAEGLQKIDAAPDTKFDPNLHEAISFEQNDKVKTDHIIAEAESGWMFNQKVIKPAKVRVSKGK